MQTLHRLFFIFVSTPTQTEGLMTIMRTCKVLVSTDNENPSPVTVGILLLYSGAHPTKFSYAATPNFPIALKVYS